MIIRALLGTNLYVVIPYRNSKFVSLRKGLQNWGNEYDDVAVLH